MGGKTGAMAELAQRMSSGALLLVGAPCWDAFRA